VAVEPGAELAESCRSNGLEVVAAPVESAAAEAEARGDVVTSFEVVEHVHDPLEFVKAVGRMARPGGLVLVTGLGGDGFDVRVLGPAAGAVSPPHHLNFLSVAGFERLFERAALVDVEVETPGELDVELVQKAGAELDPFLELLLRRRGPEVHAAFQAFLRDARLSSHTWIWARRPGP
jgi:SAM-dependent methyltransferase